MSMRKQVERRSQAERQWHRRMRIWHTLREFPGLKAYEIAKVTGIWANQVADDLREMGGVRCGRANGINLRWFAVKD